MSDKPTIPPAVAEYALEQLAAKPKAIDRIVTANHLRQYIGKASFAHNADRQAALDCVDVIAADNCEVLRARLARYGDDQGVPIAQVGGVVLPEPLRRGDEGGSGEYGAAMIRGYNACLREVARLNPAPNHSEQVRDGFLLARETVIELPGGGKELGYTPMPGLGVFVSDDEVFSAIRELGLPLGWVSVQFGQVIAAAPSPASQKEQK